MDDTLTVASVLEELKSGRAVELPHWLKIQASVRYSSLSRSKIYELIDEGAVRSVCLRSKDKLRGTRLIWRPSLDAYLSQFENVKSEPILGRKGRKSKAEKEAEVA